MKKLQCEIYLVYFKISTFSNIISKTNIIIIIHHEGRIISNSFFGSCFFSRNCYQRIYSYMWSRWIWMPKWMLPSSLFLILLYPWPLWRILCRCGSSWLPSNIYQIAQFTTPKKEWWSEKEDHRLWAWLQKLWFYSLLLLSLLLPPIR